MASNLKSFSFAFAFVLVGALASAQQTPATVVAEPEEVLKTSRSFATDEETIQSPHVRRHEEIERRLKALQEEDDELARKLKHEPKASFFQRRVEVNTQIVRLLQERDELLETPYESASQEERKVRDKLHKQYKTDLTRKNREADAARSAYLTCPNDFEGETIVSPNAVAKAPDQRQTVSITVFAPSDLGPLNVVLGHRGQPVVQNMCPGGQVTLTFSRQFFASERWREIRLTAVSSEGETDEMRPVRIRQIGSTSGWGVSSSSRSYNWRPFERRSSRVARRDRASRPRNPRYTGFGQYGR
jgi:hypothetical protein